LAFSSYYVGVGVKKDKKTGKVTKAAPSSQFTISSAAAKKMTGAGGSTISVAWSNSAIRTYSNADRQKLMSVDDVCDTWGFNKTNGSSKKLNVSHLVYRWIWRRNYWDPATGTSKPRDAARFAWECKTRENFVADLLVLDPAYDPECARMEFGLECSHMAESCHNADDWSQLDHYLCPLTIQGIDSDGIDRDMEWLKKFKEFKQGYKVEWVRFEANELNSSRQACTTFQFHWHELGGSSIDFREFHPRELIVTRQRAGVDGGVDVVPLLPRFRSNDQSVSDQGPLDASKYTMIMPEQWPTMCPHSSIVDDRLGVPVACYGRAPEVLMPITGLSGHRLSFGLANTATQVSPGEGHGLFRFPLVRDGARPVVEATPPPPSAGTKRVKRQG
jgi:hypothetical protein